MSDMAKEARAAMKAKAKRLGSDRPTEKVDSSTWTPLELLNADVQTGMRPISRRAYKSGGKVYGAKAAANMGKAPRSGNKPITADSLVNKDMKEANEEREGVKHIGGLKSGGRAKKLGGGPLPASIGNAQAMMDRAKATAGVPVSNLVSQTRPGSNRFRQATGFKKGGSAEKHDDVKEDKALIKKMVKPSARTGKDAGGSAQFNPQPAEPLSEQDDISSAGRVAGARLAGKLSGNLLPNGGRSQQQQEYYEPQKRGGRAKRATGGGIFSGPGYPGKVPGVVPGGRDAHARGGKAGKGKTNINIVIAAGKPAGAGDMMANPMGGTTKPPGMGGMPDGMPIAVPPPAGGPPGGAPMPMPMPIPMPGPAGPAGPPGMSMPRKSGGRATSYKDMTAGAGSGEGRLQKTEIAESKRSARKVGGRTYSSYKDMDAGAGGGFGRLEKAEIASKTARIEKGNY